MSNRTGTVLTKALGLSIALALAATAAEAQTAISGKNVTFPIVLTKSGNYKLTNNLNVPPGVDGIVLASGVNANIDLAGFTISGGGDCSQDTACYQWNGTIGIRIDAFQTVQVSNGLIRGFTTAAVGQPSGFNWAQVIAKDLKVSNNGTGISSYLVMAENVFAFDNASGAINAETGSVINSVAAGNGAGIAVNQGTIRGCVASHNTNYGFSVQRTPHQDNSTFDNGATPIQGVSAFSPGFNNTFLD